MEQQWANRASSAEAAVTARHFARLWATPGTQLGVVAWPSTRQNRLFATWNYWWQAHLLDCLVDAQVRDPQPVRRKRIAAQLRGHHLRNAGRWTNSYYDDMAWIFLARTGQLRQAQMMADWIDETLIDPQTHLVFDGRTR